MKLISFLEGSELKPDIWIVDFAVNVDSSKANYRALLGLLLTDEQRFR